MKNLNPKALKKLDPLLITCEWQGGFKSTISLEKLRSECPCAECQNERRNTDTKINIPMLKTFKVGMNDLKSLEKVGNYALRAIWGDGHDTGIYDWEYLRNVFEKHKLSDKEISEIEAKSNK